MKKSSLGSLRLSVTLAALLVFFGTSPAHAKIGKSQGADFVFGGLGTGPGEFTNVKDFTFSPQGEIYTLECGGPIPVGKETIYNGTGRVQKLDTKGNPISQFPLGADLGNDRNTAPFRIAVDSKGNVFVSFQAKGVVRQYGPDGKIVKDFPMPRATGLAVDKIGDHEYIAVAADTKKNKDATSGGDTIELLDPAGGESKTVKLPVQLFRISQLAVDKNGNFYVNAQDRMGIYVFDPTGKKIRVIGDKEKRTNVADGSEPAGSVVVDSAGNIYTFTTAANPPLIIEYTADGKTVIQHAGTFHGADAWQGLLLAMAPDDRLWVASASLMDPKSPVANQHHFRPAILRLEPGFLNPKKLGVKVYDALKLGFFPTVTSDIPYHVTNDLAPISADFSLTPWNPLIKEATVDYAVYDIFKNDIAHGQVKIPLAFDPLVVAHVPITFTPPRYGWYSVQAQVSADGNHLGGASTQIGVTPHYANIPVETSEFVKGWSDVPRQMFCGLTFVRLSSPGTPTGPTKNLEDQVTLCQKYGTTFDVQFAVEKADWTPEKLRPLVEQFKGRVPRWELFNEPNFSFTPEEFAERAKPVYDMIKEVDPKAQVIGPSVCGINLAWYEAFYKAGGSKAFDILSIHDYEGNETIDPIHWRWKFAQLRDIMSRYGDANKEIYQTERAITGVRTHDFIGAQQAIRLTLHNDLLQTLGVPSDHDSHYYLNEGGYNAVPSYIWSRSSPFPAALAMRTREAYTKGRKYVSSVDFSPTGNQIYMALRFEGGDGPVIIVRNLGTFDIPTEVEVKSGDTLKVSDVFGNVQDIPVKNGKATLAVSQFPQYLLLKSGQDVVFPKIDFGRNIAPTAQISYAGKGEGSLQTLQNGLYEGVNAGDPNGMGTLVWKGDIMVPGVPQTMDLTWNKPHTINTVFLHGLRADNGYCSLVDYDLLAWQKGEWKPIAQVKTPLPPSDPTILDDIWVTTWAMDNNFWINHFEPISTDKLRIVFHRTSYGFAADELAAAGHAAVARPMLNEIEAFGPSTPVEISCNIEHPVESAAFDHEGATATVTNTSGQPFQGVVKPSAPEGWSITPAEAPVNVEAGEKATLQFTIKPTAEIVLGMSTMDFALVDSKGAAVDNAGATLQVMAPVFILAKPPFAFNKAKNIQTLGTMVQNLTAATLSGTLKLELSGKKNIAPLEVPYGPLEPDKVSHLTIDVPDLNITEGGWIATYTTKANNLTVTVRQNLSVRQWSILGPFPGDFEGGPEKTIGENKVDITKNYTDTFGGEEKWQVVSDDAQGKLDLTTVYTKDETAVAYAAVWVKSPSARQAVLSTALAVSGKIWVNGKEVATVPVGSSFGWGQKDVPVDLKAGSNLILLRIEKGPSYSWAFLFDLVDPETHKTLGDLSYSPKPE